MAADTILGWDIGGAHLKVAALRGDRVSRIACLPSPLWQGLDHLDDALERAIAAMPVAGAHAVTMTGELSDCFRSRAEGVRTILARFARVHRRDRASVQVYAGLGGFLDARRAAMRPARVASANWIASAQFAAHHVREGLLLDIGSTTTDIVPLHGHAPRAEAFNDADRLSSEELVYTGVVRTSLMAAVRALRLGRRTIPVMAEHFATMADVYRLTGELPAGADLLAAADNGGKTVRDSARRLARMVGRDLGAAGMEDWKRCARGVADAQRQRIEAACRRVLERARVPATAPVIGAGVGRFVARKLARRLGRPYLDFASLVACAARVAPRAADCAPAVAVAFLLRDMR